jgi:hypothetical protein
MKMVLVRGIQISRSVFMPSIISRVEPFKNAEKPDFKLEKVKLDSGVDANLIIGEENNKVKYEMNFIQNDIEYDFYAELPPTFFKENELNLKK